MGMECVDYAELLNKVGLPISLLAALIYAIFKTFSWVAPRIDKYVSEYHALANRKADTLEKATQECAKHQAETAELLRTLNQLAEKLDKSNVIQSP